MLAPAALAQTWVLTPSKSTASLRGTSVVTATEAWASGTGGTCLHTIDGGESWIQTPVAGASKVDFRGVVGLGSNSALLMASGEGAQSAVYRTGDGGGTWSLLFADPDPKGFFDTLVTTNDGTGMLLGDPVNGAFTLFRWNLKQPRPQRITLPPAFPGEGAFAASNTAMAVRGAHVWFGTGGKSGARVFRSSDGGKSWSIARTALGGGDGAGIFSLAFRDEQHGIAVGGDYTKPNERAHSIAVTTDGGATWTEPADSKPRGYRSGVAWLPDHRIWITVGPSGSEWSRDDGQHWTPFDDGPFHAIGVGPGDLAYATGPNGRIGKLMWTATSHL